MDFAKIIKTLEDGVNFVESLTPLATTIGGPIVGNLASTVETVTYIAHNVIARGVEGEHVLTSSNEAEIKALLDRLAVQNDKLAEAISLS